MVLLFLQKLNTFFKNVNDLKNFIHAENPTFHKNSSIKTMSEKTRGDERFLPNKSSFFDNNENAITCDYYNINELNKLNIITHTQQPFQTTS